MTQAKKTRLLAERVMGCEVVDSGIPGLWVAFKDGNVVFGAKTWSPLTNLAHAGEVLEAMAKKGWSARIATNALSSDQNGCEFFHAGLGLGRSLFIGGYQEYGPDKRVCAVAPTIPAAICHAALLATGVKEEEL